MEYIEVFNKLDQKLSNKIDELQKQQEKLLERKKYLLETKQKIHCFLSDAYEMKQLLDFNPDLIHSVSSELGKIFTEGKSLDFKKTNQIKASEELESMMEAPIESSSDFMNTQDLDPSLVIDSDEEEPIKIYKFIDSDGKDTAF